MKTYIFDIKTFFKLLARFNFTCETDYERKDIQ